MMFNRIIKRVIVAVIATAALLGIAGQAQAVGADRPSPALAVAASVTSEFLAGATTAPENGVEFAAQVSLTSDAGSLGIGDEIRKFISKNWNRIVDAAKRAGVWAWYKAHICAAGATEALYKFSGGNPAVIVALPGPAFAAAAAGCVAALAN